MHGHIETYEKMVVFFLTFQQSGPRGRGRAGEGVSSMPTALARRTPFLEESERNTRKQRVRGSARKEALRKGLALAFK